MRVDEYCRAVIRANQLTAGEQAVLWMLGYYVNRRNGETFVSLQTIADDVGATYRWVRRVADKMERAGIFRVSARPGRSSIYRFPIHPALVHNPAPTDPGSVSAGLDNPAPRMHTTPRRNDIDPAPYGATNQKNQVSNRAPLRARPRPELVESGLYGEEHWNVR